MIFLVPTQNLIKSYNLVRTDRYWYTITNSNANSGVAPEVLQLAAHGASLFKKKKKEPAVN